MKITWFSRRSVQGWLNHYYVHYLRHQFHYFTNSLLSKLIFGLLLKEKTWPPCLIISSCVITIWFFCLFVNLWHIISAPSDPGICITRLCMYVCGSDTGINLHKDVFLRFSVVIGVAPFCFRKDNPAIKKIWYSHQYFYLWYYAQFYHSIHCPINPSDFRIYFPIFVLESELFVSNIELLYYLVTCDLVTCALDLRSLPCNKMMNPQKNF